MVLPAKHNLQTETEGVHQTYNWVWANATARLAQAVTADELNRQGLQLDNYSEWLLIDAAPTWQRIGDSADSSLSGDFRLQTALISGYSFGTLFP